MSIDNLPVFSKEQADEFYNCEGNFEIFERAEIILKENEELAIGEGYKFMSYIIGKTNEEKVRLLLCTDSQPYEDHEDHKFRELLDINEIQRYITLTEKKEN